MFNPNELLISFDPETRIIHFTAKKQINVKTSEELSALCRGAKEFFDQHLSSERGYFITDLTKLIIEPELHHLYAIKIKEIVDTYLYPGGIARYGLGITRVVAIAGHASLIDGDPNLFNSKKEAYKYIHDLIEQRKSAVVPSK